MRMRPPLAELFRRLRGWLIPVALLALVPKCILCALAYAGIGATLGLGGTELCGVNDADRPRETALLVLSVTTGYLWLLARRNRAQTREPPHSAGTTAISSTSKTRPENGGMLPTCMLP